MKIEKNSKQVKSEHEKFCKEATSLWLNFFKCGDPSEEKLISEKEIPSDILRGLRNEK